AALVDPTALSVRLSKGLALAYSTEPFTTIDIGIKSGHPFGYGGPVAAVYTTQAEWQTFLIAHKSPWTPPIPPPAVAVGTNAVLVAFHGFAGTGGTSLHLDRITYGAAGLIVESTYLFPQSCGASFVQTQPYHIVAIPKAVALQPQSFSEALGDSC